MKKKKVIANKNLPTRIPLWSTITLYLFLDRLHAPQWYGVLVACLYLLFGSRLLL